MTKKPRLNLAARTFRVELGTFLHVCESVNTVRSLGCYLLAKAGEWDQYLSLSRPDIESSSFADDYLVTEAMRKNPQLIVSTDPRKEAVKTWWAAEKQCAETNERIVSYTQGGVSPLDRRTNAVIAKAQRIIMDILGPLNRFKLDYCESKMRYGPGATSSVSGPNVVTSKKYTCEMHVSPRLYPYWKTLVPRSANSLALRAYSKVTFVTKTALTHRAIAIEPHLNSFVQLGIGALLRQRLKRYGLDLDHQADINRRLAGIAHKCGLATVDLSSASDTIAYQLVWLLLPYEWASLLDLARVEYSVLDDEEVKLSKFSSMGNGYTFELESLIFLALARASGDNEAVTFGDDIIIKRESYPLLKTTLDFLGFNVNTKKTFLAGRFFESCGYDYKDGVMIRPFYFKGDYHHYSSACIRISNKVRRYSHLRNGGYGCDARFYSAWIFASRKCPIAKLTCTSLGSGDDGLICNINETKVVRARHGHEGFIARVLRERVWTLRSHTHPGALMHSLHRGAEFSEKSLEMTREFKDATLGRQVIPRWYDLGPWI